MIKPTCNHDADRGWLSVEHLRDCSDRECAGCKPCGEDHCGLRGCAHHVDHGAGIFTCPRCIGKTRRDLTAVVELYALVPTAAELRGNDLGPLLEEAADAGIESEAFNLIGPAAAPEQYSEKRARLRALYERRGWCDWPRHEGFREDDPHHPYAVLGRWDMAMRESYGPQTDLFITVGGAADYLTGLLSRPDSNFAHTHEFEDFSAEIRKCREHLEQVTHDARRAEEGRQCPRCREASGTGPRLRKRYSQHGNLNPGEQCHAEGCRTCAGDLDTWHCPAVPEHWWSEPDYRARVDGDYVKYAAALTARQLHETYGVRPGSVRGWASLGKVRKRGRDTAGLTLYDVADTLTLAGVEREASSP